MSEADYRPYTQGTQAPNNSPDYRSTAFRHPREPLLRVPQTITELSAPRFSRQHYPSTIDISRTHGREAVGERIVVAGRVVDENGKPVPNVMIELWQANAAGRYDHDRDSHDAPLDPNFHGTGRLFTDDDGCYRFQSIKPGAYPWRNHHNAWRPNHIHYSLFGSGFAQRLVTQMYFPGDPLLDLDPIYQATPDRAARERLIGQFTLDLTMPEYALGYRFDVVLRGRDGTPFEDDHGHH